MLDSVCEYVLDAVGMLSSTAVSRATVCHEQYWFATLVSIGRGLDFRVFAESLDCGSGFACVDPFMVLAIVYGVAFTLRYNRVERSSRASANLCTTCMIRELAKLYV